MRVSTISFVKNPKANHLELLLLLSRKKNLGSNYVLKVNEKLLLSLGEHTRKVLVQHDFEKNKGL